MNFKFIGLPGLILLAVILSGVNLAQAQILDRDASDRDNQDFATELEREDKEAITPTDNEEQIIRPGPPPSPRPESRVDPDRLQQDIRDTRDRALEEGQRIREAMPTLDTRPTIGQTAREQARTLRETNQADWAARRQVAQDRLNQLSIERREAALNRVSEIQRERIAQYAERMFIRLQAAILRLDTLANRVEDRLNHFTNDGINTDNAEATLAVARDLITDSHEALSQAEQTVIDLLADEDPMAIFPDVRAEVRQVADLIRQAHLQIIEAVTLMRQTQAAEPAEDPIEEDETNGDNQTSPEE